MLIHVTGKGKVFTWGSGSHGRLGHGDRANQLKPKLVEFFEAENMSMQSISVGYNHSAALNGNSNGILATIENFLISSIIHPRSCKTSEPNDYILTPFFTL